MPCPVSAGYLVYFTRPMTMHRAVSPTEPTPRSLSALSAYHSGLITPMKIRTETPGNLRLYSGSPTRSEKEQVSISSFYYKERVHVSLKLEHRSCERLDGISVAQALLEIWAITISSLICQAQAKL
ncbi:wd repeat-containing protein hypothetical protein [Limosa lapponica baueri]|uniref:Uncharacterized protein n=1 Tax=Limosa lapponica baueri TaxID=1758121 RepID=A0A2I0TAL3_LIMLA|nr:wd repeat-containing protein hypothetical protein [Limosa lapponica baueri]